MVVNMVENKSHNMRISVTITVIGSVESRTSDVKELEPAENIRVEL